MSTNLSAPESKLLGMILEAQLLDPGNYPVSVKYLIGQLANNPECSDRELADRKVVTGILQSLEAKRLLEPVKGGALKAKRFKHRFGLVERPLIELTRAELAVLGALLLNGPLGPAEIFEQASRYCEFDGPADILTVINRSLRHSATPLVHLLPFDEQQSGQRYTHLFDPLANAAMESSDPAPLNLEQRLAKLEAENAQLLKTLGLLQRQVDLLFSVSPTVSKKSLV